MSDGEGGTTVPRKARRRRYIIVNSFVLSYPLPPLRKVLGTATKEEEKEGLVLGSVTWLALWTVVSQILSTLKVN